MSIILIVGRGAEVDSKENGRRGSGGGGGCVVVKLCAKFCVMMSSIRYEWLIHGRIFSCFTSARTDRNDDAVVQNVRFSCPYNLDLDLRWNNLEQNFVPLKTATRIAIIEDCNANCNH